MSFSATYQRIGTGVVVVALVLVVFLLGRPGDDPSPPTPEGTPSSAASPASPAPSPVSGEEFCDAFRFMAAAHSNHVANDTPATLAELGAAAAKVLQLAPGTTMPPGARQGLEELVAGVLGTSTAAPDETAADALSAYLDTSCPAAL